MDQKQYSHIQQAINLSQIYANFNNALENRHQPRYEEFSKRFADIYGMELQRIIRAPAIAILLGNELLDDACSISLEQDIIVAYSVDNSDTIEVRNIQNAQFPKFTQSTDPKQKFTSQEKSVQNIFLAGYKAALGNIELQKPKGLKVLIAGSIPYNCDLGNPTALLSAVSVMVLEANNLIEKANQEVLISNLLKFEQILMQNRQTKIDKMMMEPSFDQKVSFFNTKIAKDTRNIKLPIGSCFIIANSCSPSSLILTRGTRKQKRECEIVLAIALLQESLGYTNFFKFKTLSEFQKSIDYSNQDMISMITQLDQEKSSYSKDDILQILKLEPGQLFHRVEFSKEVIEQNWEYLPFKRALYLYQEALLIERLHDICQDTNNQNSLEQIGQIMDESHENMLKNYENTSDEIEKLRKLFKGYGALGCKMIGNGWGGCVIALVKSRSIEITIQKIMQNYYLNTDNKLLVGEDLSMLICPTYNSGKGVIVFDPQYEIWF